MVGVQGRGQIKVLHRTGAGHRIFFFIRVAGVALSAVDQKEVVLEVIFDGGPGIW